MFFLQDRIIMYNLFLQNIAKENLIAIFKYHSGSVWLTLHSMVARRTLSRPGFPSIVVRSNNGFYC